MEKVLTPNHTVTTTADKPVVYSTANPFPEQPCGQRVVLELPSIDSLLNLERIESKLITGDQKALVWKDKTTGMIIPDEVADKMMYNLGASLIAAKVIAVGDLHELEVVPGDMVKVFINQFEAVLVVDGKDYKLYPERCIITKTIK